MNGLIDRVTKSAIRRGFRNGLLAGDGKWVAAGAVALLVRFLAKPVEREVVVEELGPGEAIVVTNIGPALQGRRARKARRATKAERLARASVPAE